MSSYTKFKKIFSIFQTTQQKEKDQAILNFYNQVTSSSLEQVDPLISTYAAAGFRVTKSHSGLLEQDPLDYLLEKIYLAKEGSYRFTENNNHILEKIWVEAFDPEYKKEIIKNQPKLKPFLKRAETTYGTNIEKLFNEYFNAAPNFTFYVNNVLNPTEIKKVSNFQKTINHCLLHYSEYPTLHSIEIAGFKKLSAILNKAEVEYDKSKLFEIFKNEKPINTNEVSVEQKSLNSMIKTLKLYDNQFGELDHYQKVIFNEILTQLTEINNSQHIANYPEVSAKIGNLVHKHLPELLSEFFEIPEKFRNTYKDNKGVTPKQTFDEALSGISNNVKDLMEEVYNHNFTNIKVKNRFIKIK